MKRLITTALMVGFLGYINLWAQAGSEIYLFDMEEQEGSLVLSNPVNVSQHTGYDNQPFFHRNEPLIYYSSFNDDGRSDIKVYNINTGERNNLTKTQEREYSPTLTPDGQFISCIIQRDNDAQDLGKYPVAGGSPEVLIDDLIVGYHSWMDGNRLILFVLGEPHALHLYDLKSQSSQVVAKNIGRSLHAIPGQDAMSFIQLSADGAWQIQRLDNESLQISTIAEVEADHQDICWTQHGWLLMSDSDQILWTKPGRSQDWQKVRFEGDQSMLKGITRMAVNSMNTKIAVVVSE